MSRITAPPRGVVAGLALAMLTAQATVLLAMGRPAICVCGYVALWHGSVDAGNSQHLADWYSPSHIIHGLLLYAALRLLLPLRAVGARLLMAMATEIGWELLENSPPVIARYRATATALGYTGDSVVNSLGDVGCMILGFLLASRLPAWAGVSLALSLELAAYLAIRDNLTLNVVALLGTFR